MSQATTTQGKSIKTDREQFCTFRIANLLFGLEVLSVQEVLVRQPMTRVPLANEVISGLINLRGQIVTAIDLRTRLGFPPLPEDKHPMNVVIRSGDTAYSLLVDEIGEVVNVSADSFETPPETLTGTARQLILGAYKLEGQLLLVLDTERAVTIDPVA